MNNPYFFVLGAPDHEMREVERVCSENGFGCGYATIQGVVVRSYDAYSATGCQKVIPTGSKVVMVECAVRGLRCDDIIDHHNPGDPGFGKTPEQYFEGSSLGQFLRLVGIEPTQRQRVIAAADHCLTAAYQGRCPGVSPDELREFREETRSRARNLPRDELKRQIEVAVELLHSAQTVTLADTPVAFLDNPPPEAGEASARIGLPYMYIRAQEDGRKKAGIRSAPPKVVQAWMDECGLNAIYGDPQRGFAGGYFA